MPPRGTPTKKYELKPFGPPEVTFNANGEEMSCQTYGKGYSVTGRLSYHYREQLKAFEGTWTPGPPGPKCWVFPSSRARDVKRFLLQLNGVVDEPLDDPSKPPTAEQLKIYDFVSNRTENLLVKALAGAGKSFTIMRAARERDQNGMKVLLLAFNKNIQTKNAEMLGDGSRIDSLTVHKWAMRLLQRHRRTQWHKPPPPKTPNFMSPQERQLAVPLGLQKLYWMIKKQEDAKPHSERLLPSAQLTLAKLVSKAQEKRLDFAASIEEIQTELFEDTSEDISNLELQEMLAPRIVPLLRQTLQEFQNTPPTSTVYISFSDALWLPTVLEDISFVDDPYDLYFIDEAQDLNPVMIELFRRLAAAKPAARFIFVGDPNQSIYAFRGATANSMQVIEEAFPPIEALPLRQTFRCPKLHCELASLLLPDPMVSFVGGGSLQRLSWELLKQIEFRAGDVVLSRRNKVLIELCYEHPRLLRFVGEDLIKMVNHFSPSAKRDSGLLQRERLRHRGGRQGNGCTKKGSGDENCLQSKAI